ncbi:thioredoxin domain-containing protein [Salmonella enterica subsp. enterica serovar Havana]|nr:thioredoxin domain-containing protein [Salmonella enterica subsp. enterica serovar Havana]HAZ2978953.1 thioredoxin domain-containing protein [Salmonella enterica subsp. enterica serovar Havana]
MGISNRLLNTAFLTVMLFSFTAQAVTSETGRNSYVSENSIILGNKEAPVTIVEFFDPACEGCANMFPYVKNILKDNSEEVRLVLRYIPLHNVISKEAIGIIEASREQNKVNDVLDSLMREQSTWTTPQATEKEIARVWEIAAAAGLNIEQAKGFIKKANIDQLLSEEAIIQNRLSVTGTPTFFVNGTRLKNNDPMELQQLVNDTIADSKKNKSEL